MVEVVVIPSVVLDWSEWKTWEEIKLDARFERGATVPNRVSGVYEVRYREDKERLSIGRASDIRMRIKQGLVRGKVPHSAGSKIRRKEDMSEIVIRWATTDRPAAIEEELHRKHVEQFGRLPKYTKHT